MGAGYLKTGVRDDIVDDRCDCAIAVGEDTSDCSALTKLEKHLAYFRLSNTNYLLAFFVSDALFVSNY